MALASVPMALTALVAPIGAHAAGAQRAAAAAPSAARPSSLRYTVVNGDYLWGIAVKLNVKFTDLLTVNSFSMETLIHPGQQLIVPEGGSLPAATPPASASTQSAAPTGAGAQPAAPAGSAYVVTNGDSLSRIAQAMGVTLGALLKANKLKVDSVIHPGQSLAIPAGGHMPAPRTGGIRGPVTSTDGHPAEATRGGAAVDPPTAAPAGGPLPAGYTNYTIVNGDYLAGIAARNGVTLKALLTANNMIVTSAIQPGQVLAVPPATLPIPGATPPAGGAPGGTPTPATPAAQGGGIATVLAYLQAQVGKPYAFNTEGPESFDCSGLVTAAYKQIGINLPHQSLMQSTKGTAVDWHTQPLLPGDLIFQYNRANPTVISHVGIVLDGSRWIQAAGSGTPVKIGPIPDSSKIVAVRRIVQA